MKKFLTCVVLLSCSILASAQREIDESADPPFKDRVYGGMGLGMSSGLSSYGYKYFYVGLYPTLGYMITNDFSTGVTITWQHYSYSDYDLSYDQYGLSPFVRYNFKQLFLYSEFMVLNSPATDNAARKNYERFLFGAGFSQPLGKRTAINVLGAYDVLYNPANRAFASPWVLRLFVTF